MRKSASKEPALERKIRELNESIGHLEVDIKSLEKAMKKNEFQEIEFSIEKVWRCKASKDAVTFMAIDLEVSKFGIIHELEIKTEFNDCFYKSYLEWADKKGIHKISLRDISSDHGLPTLDSKRSSYSFDQSRHSISIQIPYLRH